MERPNAWSLGVAVAAMASCVSSRADNTVFGDAGSASGATATAGETEDPAGSSTPNPGETGPILDVGHITDATAEGGNGTGCEKADFLFVIDNSGSMQDEQANLISSFPGFIATIQQTLMAADYHVMVTDTDASGGGSSSVTCTNGVCECEPVPACCEMVCNGFGDNCNGFPCDDLPGGGCDSTLGAGKVFRSDGTLCLTEDGPRYMTDDGEFEANFGCVAEVGTFGDGNEQPMAAMINALTAPLSEPAGCNEGFLRDDAILVVTFITDEEDVMKSPGDPASWHQQLVAAKNGNEDAIVVLGLYGDTDQPGAICSPLQDVDGAEAAPRLRAFVEAFGDHGISGSVCAPDYTPFFENAVGLIDLTCDEFVPEG